jgi:hypothetical protein
LADSWLGIRAYLRFLQSTGDVAAGTQEQLDKDKNGQFQIANQQDGKEKVMRNIALRSV